MATDFKLQLTEGDPAAPVFGAPQTGGEICSDFTGYPGNMLLWFIAMIRRDYQAKLAGFAINSPHSRKAVVVLWA